jgi:hypothetical protein
MVKQRLKIGLPIAPVVTMRIGTGGRVAGDYSFHVFRTTKSVQCAVRLCLMTKPLPYRRHPGTTLSTRHGASFRSLKHPKLVPRLNFVRMGIPRPISSTEGFAR